MKGLSVAALAIERKYLMKSDVIWKQLSEKGIDGPKSLNAP